MKILYDGSLLLVAEICCRDYGRRPVQLTLYKVSYNKQGQRPQFAGIPAVDLRS